MVGGNMRAGDSAGAAQVFSSQIRVLEGYLPSLYDRPQHAEFPTPASLQSSEQRNQVRMPHIYT